MRDWRAPAPSLVHAVSLAATLAAASVACSPSESDRPPSPDAKEASASIEPPPEHAEPIASYTLRATLDPESHTIHGEGSVTWKNASTKPISELWFHLYLNAFKNQSSVFLRTPVGGFRGSGLPDDWGTIDVRELRWDDGGESHDLWVNAEPRRPGDDDETDARVPLPRSVAPGETITLSMRWDDKLPSVVERTGYDGSFHMVAQWFPKLARLEPDGTFVHFPFHHLGEFYADYGTYDVTIDVPEKYVVGASGVRTESKHEGGRRVERRVQADIHDFAWTAWDEFGEREETIDGVKVTVLYPRELGDIAERELAALRFALPHFRGRYGRYPYDVLTVVHPPRTAAEAGGMEYPTLITTGDVWASPRGVLLPEIVTIHEFGHQYFYGLLGSNEVKWPFLDEGINSYAEVQALTAWRGGPGSAIDLPFLKVDLTWTHAERARHGVHDERLAQPAWAFATGTAYGALVYSRTAAILETMRRVYGDDAMSRVMATYARRYRFAHPTPEDFVATVRAELGEAGANALRIALFDKGWIDFAVIAMSSHIARRPAGIFDVAGRRETVPSSARGEGVHEGWVLVKRRGTLRMPVEIELVSEDGTRQRIPWDGEADSFRVPYAGSSPLRAALVDPDSRVVIDEDATNNFATAVGRAKGGAPRTLERVTYWAELLESALSP
jgi:hypothetical protein